MKMEEKVFSYIEEYNMIETGSQVLLGISGGADSVCLLFLLKEYQKRRNFTLQGIHVNHGIRGKEAQRDQEFTRKLCESLGVPLTIRFCPVPAMAAEQKLSLEEAGRMARRKIYEEECRNLLGNSDDFRIALAHHENDQAETVLHNLIRGTGAGGMAGIRPVQKEKKKIYIRPLLCVSRKEIREYLKKREISWVEDSTNQDLSYTRNRIRKILIPEMEQINPKAVVHMGMTAGYMEKIEEYLEEQADKLYGDYVKLSEDQYVVSGKLSAEKEIMQEYVLKKVLVIAAGSQKDISRIHVETVKKLLSADTGARVFLPYGLQAQQVYGSITIGKEKKEKKKKAILEFRTFPYEKQQIPEKTYTKWFDYDKIKDGLEVRFRLPGDYFMLGIRGGRKKLKDYFIDCKIPRQERDRITLLAEGSHILWVVGSRISEYYKITSQTKTVLEVHVKGVKEDE